MLRTVLSALRNGILGFAACWLVVATPAVAAQQDVTEAQPWQFDSFTEDAGLQGCSILHCATAPDGRVWFATSAGLASYDGYDWSRYRVEHGLPSDYVRCVAFTAAGVCWVGTDQGAVRFDPERGVALPTETHLAGPSVRRIATDPRSDAVWFCCDQWPDPTVSAGLTRFAQGEWQSWTTAQGLPSDYIQTMLIDSRGRHFVGTKRGLVELREDVASVVLMGDDDAGSVVWSIAEETDGAIVVGIGYTVRRLVDARWTRLPLVDAGVRPLLLVTRDGTLRIDSRERRVLRLYREAAVPVSANWSPRSNGIEHAMEAEDGAIWLVGHNELLRWRRGGEWRLYADCPSPVLTDATGVTWFVDHRGTFVFADDRWLVVGPVTRSLCLGPQGSVWGVRGGRVVRWRGGSLAAHEEVATEIARVSRLVANASAIVIAGTDADGGSMLLTGTGEQWHRPTLPAGIDSSAVTTITAGVGAEFWMLTHEDDSGRRVFHVAADRLVDAGMPGPLLQPNTVRLAVDPQGSAWVHGIFGLFHRQDASWEQITSVPGRDVHAAYRVGESLGFLTRGTSGGESGVILTRLQDGERAWQRVEVSADVALGTDARGRLLLSDTEALYRVDSRGEVSAVRMPTAMDIRTAVVGKGEELWFSGGGNGQVLRYVPDGLAPRARLVWLDSALTENERLVLDIEVSEHNKPRAVSRDARVMVEVDGAPAGTYTQAQRPYFLNGLSAGKHRIRAIVEDDSGARGAVVVGGDVIVSTRPLQERPWFWAAAALAMLAVLLLACHSWLVSRRLAAQTRSLTATVEQRTNELRARDEVLLHVEKMEAVGRLAGGVAHDFNNLLTVILGNVDLVRRALGPDADPEMVTTLDEVDDASRRAGTLTRQLLAFSRQEASDATNADVIANVRALAGLLRRMIPGNIDLRLELPDDAVVVRAGRVEIEQILTNLVLNAADSMPEGGPLTVSVLSSLATPPGQNQAQSFARIEVRDVGCGMTDDVKSRALDPYFTTKPRGRGTGLGLSIVHGVLTRVSGFIELDSLPGVGTSVRAFLPTADAPGPTPIAIPHVQRRGDGRTLLLCEDEPALLQLSARILEDAGYRVLASPTVDGALLSEAEHDGPIDAVITDVVTPERSGVELARALEARRPGVPVLFISGYADQVLASYQLDPESLRLLHKPFDRAQLLQAVAETLAQRPVT